MRIAVLTYQRPQDIEAALPRLALQAESVATDQVSADIVSWWTTTRPVARERWSRPRRCGSGAGALRERGHPGHLRRPQPRSVHRAATSTLLVFIDDDERPSRALAAPAAGDLPEASLCGGRRLGGLEFEVEPDAWVKSGSFFDRRRLPTGTELDVAATNNLLLDLHQVRELGPRLRPAVRAERWRRHDVHPYPAPPRRGAIIWCDEAVVVDVVPAARVTRDWVLRGRSGAGRPGA